MLFKHRGLQWVNYGCQAVSSSVSMNTPKQLCRAVSLSQILSLSSIFSGPLCKLLSGWAFLCALLSLIC